MLNIGEGSSKYVKVWHTEDKGNYVKVQCSSSQKQQDGTYENSSWFVNFVGKAKNKASSLVKGSTLEIKQGGISNKYDKDKKITYYNLVVFDYELIGTQPDGVNEAVKTNAEFETVDEVNKDDLPF